MAFPTSPILDNFNYANENPASTYWAGPVFSGSGQWQVLSNQLQLTSGGSFKQSYYKVSQYGPDCEVWCTLTTVASSSQFNLYARTQSAGLGGASPTLYYLAYDPAVPDFDLRKVVTGTDTRLLQTTGISLSANDGIGLSVIGNVLTSYKRSGLAGSWVQQSQTTDAANSIPGAGYLAVEANIGFPFVVDDFGGGNLNSAAKPSDDPPIGMLGRGAGW